MLSGEVEVYDAALERATFSGSLSELRKGHHAVMEPWRRGSAHALSLAAQVRWSGCRRHGCRAPLARLLAPLGLLWKPLSPSRPHLFLDQVKLRGCLHGIREGPGPAVSRKASVGELPFLWGRVASHVHGIPLTWSQVATCSQVGWVGCSLLAHDRSTQPFGFSRREGHGKEMPGAAPLFHVFISW